MKICKFRPSPETVVYVDPDDNIFINMQKAIDDNVINIVDGAYFAINVETGRFMDDVAIKNKNVIIGLKIYENFLYRHFKGFPLIDETLVNMIPLWPEVA